MSLVFIKLFITVLLLFVLVGFWLVFTKICWVLWSLLGGSLIRVVSNLLLLSFRFEWNSVVVSNSMSFMSKSEVSKSTSKSFSVRSAASAFES